MQATAMQGLRRPVRPRWACRVGSCRRSLARALPKKELWLQTSDQACLTTAIEAGHSTVLFPADQAERAEQWSRLAAFRAVFQQPDGALVDAQGQQFGRVLRVGSAEELRAAEAAAATQPGLLVMDATDWQVIPAENLVAAAQQRAGGSGGSAGGLMGVAASAADARVLLEALEVGTAGVLLRTEDAAEVRQLAEYLRQRDAASAERMAYEAATVTQVTPVGMADRVCVDLCCMLGPGEGMLVGSFARGLFLVHSECMASAYINSRPFRVNAGAVHAYVQVPGGRTAYLSELTAGREVLVADAGGATRPALVGRCKLEARPMLLVEAEAGDGDRVSTLLQNAETVRLVGPSGGGGGGSSSGGDSGSSGSGDAGWRAVSVSELRPGDQVYVLRQEGARHTGLAISERVCER